MEIANPTTVFGDHQHTFESTDKFHIDGMVNLDEFKAEWAQEFKAERGHSDRKPSHANILPSGDLVPKPLGARSSQNTVAFHDKIQYHGLGLPKFVYDGLADTAEWSAKVEFLGEVLEEAGPFPSKKEAKEALSGKALEVIKRKEADGTLQKPVKGKKQKRVLGTVDNADGVKKEEEAHKEVFVNYNGLLHGVSSPSHELRTPLYSC